MVSDQRHDGSPFTREPAAARRTAREVGAALVLYTILALVLTASAWTAPQTRWAGSCCDPEQEIWFLRWFPAALERGENPLLTDRLNAPHGVNLMWNASMPLIGLAVAPISLTAGPVLAYNVALVGAIALSGLAAFLALRRIAGGLAGALVGGLVYAFSPYMASHAALHLNLVAAWAPPLSVLLLHELLVRRRWSPGAVGAAAGVLAGLQLLTFEEILATSAVAAAVLLVVLAAAAPDRAARTDGVGRILAAAPAALLAFAAIAVLPLAVQFLGPQRISGRIHNPSRFSTDLLNVVLPTPYQLLAPDAATHVSRQFSTLYHEATGYLGLPLLLVLVASVVLGWRDRRIRIAGITAFILLVLSFGPELYVGHVATGIPMPWLPFSLLPLLEHATPGRLTLYMWLAIGVVVAVVVEPLLASRTPRALAGVAVVGASLLLIAPAPLTSSTVEVPPAFEAWGKVGIPDDAVILFAPHFTNGAGAAPMLWAAIAGDRPRMREAYAYVPGEGGSPRYGPAATQLTEIMDAIQDKGINIVARGDVRDRALADLVEGGITHVVVGPMDHRAQMVAFFTDLLERPPERVLGIEVWRGVGAGG